MESNKLQTKPYNSKDIIIAILVIILVIGLIYMYFFNGNSNASNVLLTSNPSNILLGFLAPKTNIASRVTDLSDNDNTPKTTTNGEYYDYSKIDIKPTITILPAKIYDTITEIKGSVVSDTLASDDYNSKYVVYSGTDKATVITPDMIPNFNTKELPKQTIEFIWADVNSGKCYVPEYFSRDLDKIVLGDCSGNNANYRWEDGFIKHVNSNRYLQTWNNNDLPEENEGLLLSKMEDYQRAEKRKFDFIQSGNNLTNAKIIHRPSEKCVLPTIGTNGKVLLSVNSTSCK
jgi:hypothetical protein